MEAVTVRQWIRRGKIKTAVKFGKEWRIKYMYLKECTLCTMAVEYRSDLYGEIR